MKLDFPKTEPFPHSNPNEWNDWKWQMKSSLKNKEDFESVFDLSEDEKSAFTGLNKIFQIRVTPYYAQLASKTEPLEPVRQMIMPHRMELNFGKQQMPDPLGEREHSPTERIVHRYPDRVLFLVTDTCSVYCRYCLRKYFTGKEQALVKKEQIEKALEYIKSKPEIREVILSGGDPLTLSDSALFSILDKIREIDHIEIIRIGTRMPVVCPVRITPELVEGLKKYSPVYIMTHFNHPKEVTLEAKQSLDLLVDNGMPVYNQMVLLNGINNHEAIVQALSRRLLYLRVKPYYMFQADPSEGTDHLRTTVEDSLEIQKNLWGKISGLAMPNLSLDIPNGGGKVGLVPEFMTEQREGVRRYKGWDGKEEDYINPDPTQIKRPIDLSDYKDEWELINKSSYGKV